jgi:thioredoxin 1
MSYDELIQSTQQTLLVDFFATWCGPCKAMAPVLDELKAELGDGVRIVKIDVDKNIDLAVAQKVMGVPTFVVYHKGVEHWRQAGTPTKETLKQVIRSAAG